MTVELSEYVIDAIADAVVRKMQEPKTGHWIKHVEPNDAEPFVLWRCDNCNTVERRRTSYCPCCGAKMESEG